VRFNLAITLRNLAVVKLVQLHCLLQGEEVLGSPVPLQGAGNLPLVMLTVAGTELRQLVGLPLSCQDRLKDGHARDPGVHTNSGVPNHAYALMVDGGTYNGFTITGIGLTKAGKIQYRALTQYLVSGSKFLADYLALQQSCTDLIGTAGISASDCAEVKKALDAVEMSKTPCT
jgi:hypothetical protein